MAYSGFDPNLSGMFDNMQFARGETLPGRVGRGASWLLNLESRGHGFKAAMTRPLELFGFNLYGQGSQSSLGFAGFRLQAVEPTAPIARGQMGRVWISQPGQALGMGGEHGRWGTMRELWQESNRARIAKGGVGGVARQARMLGARFIQPAAMGIFGFMNYSQRRAAGQGVFEAAAKTVAEEAAIGIGLRLAIPLLGVPGVAVAGAIAGMAGLGIMYRNKMSEFRQNVRKTEFVGDMSSFQTHAALTMRQRSLRSIQRSFLNARTALGTEAQFHHMAFAPRGTQRMLAGAM